MSFVVIIDIVKNCYFCCCTPPLIAIKLLHIMPYGSQYQNLGIFCKDSAIEEKLYRIEPYIFLWHYQYYAQLNLICHCVFVLY